MKALIVTGDDFGLALPINEAIEDAHRDGILTTASLMVGASAAQDAIERARRLHSLKVGLHLVLVEGRPVSNPYDVPDLVDDAGAFSTHLVRTGIKFYFQPRVRRQLAREIRAQFEAFHRTGLELDHVNAHNHMHVHPTVLGLILEIGREFGLRAVRVPYEPLFPSLRATRSRPLSRILSWASLWPWIQLMRLRLRLAGIASNDFVFGLHDSGHVTPHLLTRFLRFLPQGVTEIYCHPAVRRCPEIDRSMPDYESEGEYQSLISPTVKATVTHCGIRAVGFSDCR